MAGVAVTSFLILALTLLYNREKTFLTSARECTSIDVRNSVSSLSALDGCAVVKGYLIIVLITRNVSTSDYGNLTFPELREITDFLMFHDVSGLTEFKKLFPNLVVIRGRRLFLSYALAVSNMPDLATIEFRSLIAIQRGHVYIGNSPKLCFLQKINWDRLTLTSGVNTIIPFDDSLCAPSSCIGCDYCWSNRVCQKFENDNLINLSLSGNGHCHTQCLGGCYNESQTGCNVCKGISDHGTCVIKCSPNLYYSENHQRCYTKEECYDVRGYLIGAECNRKCPSGYNRSRKNGECIKCATKCINECAPEEPYQEIIISSLSEAEALKGCQHLKGSLFIQIGNKVEEKDLEASFSSLQEVDGHVKVFYSPHLKSLRFLKNLEKINGNPLENGTFAIVLYNNENLKELWIPQAGKTVELGNGGIYSYANTKLCDKILYEFSRNIVHNNDMDVIQTNDEEITCEPVKLNVNEEASTQNSVVISWTKIPTVDEVEIIYREAKYNEAEKIESVKRICRRIHWKRELMLTTDIQQNSSHFFFNISDLLPYTSYDYLLKTFREKKYYSARSLMKRFVTKADLPTAPKLATSKKSFENITLTWIKQNAVPEEVKYFILETFEHSIDLENLDTRNFCDQPVYYSQEISLEDYDDCCEQEREQIEDDEFKRDMEGTFACNINSEKNCHSLVKNGYQTTISVIDSKLKNFTVNGLKHFTRYTFFLYGCNEIGCGTYSMYSDRTKIVKSFDIVTYAYSCRDPKTLGYFVKFTEPHSINGAILNYHIHFKNSKPDNVAAVDTGHVYCISRKQFENSGYKTVIKFENSSIYNKIAIRVITTGGGGKSKWFDIEVCPPSKPKNSVFQIYIYAAIAIGILLFIWFCYRRNWLNILEFSCQRRETCHFGSNVRMDDRAELVDNFDTVAFQNIPDGNLL